MAALRDEVERFKEWAKAYPPEQRGGEWECNYPFWDDLHSAALAFFGERPYASWSAEERAAILYALARDNEDQRLATDLRSSHAELLLPLCRAALESGEADAKWQLASELGRLEQGGGEAERLLRQLATDEAEYVRRMAIQGLARSGSAATEELALGEWQRADENQQWARMMALWCLHRVGSPHLARLLDDAEKDEREHLSAYARRLRKGEVEA